MASKPYNGFSADERSRGGRWYRTELAAGRRSRPTKCDACGQTAGIIDAHSEDYSAPYGEHIGAFGLCYRCHMMIHCRFRNPEIWKHYVREVSQGYVFQAFHTRDFQQFCAEMLEGPVKQTAVGQGFMFAPSDAALKVKRAPRPNGLLERIDRGEFANRGRPA